MSSCSKQKSRNFFNWLLFMIVIVFELFKLLVSIYKIIWYIIFIVVSVDDKIMFNEIKVLREVLIINIKILALCF